MDISPKPKLTTSDVCDALGRKAMSDRLGVTIAAVSNASNDETFPARWFPAIREMCAAIGQDCPETLFSFIGDAPKVKARAQQQGAA